MSAAAKRQVMGILADLPGHASKFAALVGEFAELGHIKNWTKGHYLGPPYEDLFEFKPPLARVFGFRRGSEFIVVSAARKVTSKKQQARDYQRADNLRITYCNQLDDNADGPRRT